MRLDAVFRSRFVWLHGLIVPLSLILVADGLRFSGWDDQISQWFFDPATQAFPARASEALERWGHGGAKSVVLALWLGLLLAALAAPWVPRLKAHRRLLWLTVAAMGLGPALVAGIKDINTHACPWDLKAFGGTLDYSAQWFVPRSQAGRCFPGGHAAGGFSLVALAFAARALGSMAWSRWLLLATVLVGGAFSLVRLSQGAHFMSHNLWAAAVDWAVAAWLLAPMVQPRNGS